MTDRKQELIELVAKTIADVESNKPYNADDNPYGQFDARDYVDISKAIIELLDVEVVGDNSEAWEGDVVSIYDDEDRKIYGRIAKNGQFFGEKILFRDEYINLKIIQREGRPVINVDRIKNKSGANGR